MGDKGKGKESGSGKKPKAVKVGNRPHEQRARETLKKGPTGPVVEPSS
jgi:hypothetical protein